MEIKLKRDVFTDVSTTGQLSIDGKFFCFILEDVDRKLENNPSAKVYGKTAIPRGRYQIVVNMSQRFKRHLPLLVNVPGFEGIRIHVGNSAKDTDGCLLPGSTRVTNWVTNSTATFAGLLAEINNAINSGEKVFITIE